MLGALVVAAAAVVVDVVVILAAAGRLRRNGVAGIRIPSLLASDDAWLRGHRAAVPPTTVGAVICVVLAAVVLADATPAPLGTALETAVLLVGVLVGTVLASRAPRRPGGAAGTGPHLR